MSKKVYALIMEWDGNKPSSTFYARRNKLCDMKVRGDKEINIITRRAKEDIGAILQEGCIVSSSESLIDTLAMIAEEEAARQGVSISTMVIEGEMRQRKTSEEVFNFFRRVQDVFGMRGRKPLPETFVVTCLERLETYFIEAVGVAATPKGSLRFNVIKANSIPNNKVPSTFEQYINARFTSGTFIVGSFSENGKDIPQDINISDELKNKLASISNGYNTGKLPVLTNNGEMLVIDAVVAARLYYSKEDVMNARLSAITEYFKLGGTPDKVKLMVDDNCADVLDGAVILGPELVAQWALKIL